VVGPGARLLLTTLFVCAGLLALVMSVVWGVSAAAGFPFEDRITAVFCGSKKTLASGVPMAQLIFRGDRPSASCCCAHDLPPAAARRLRLVRRAVG